MEQTLGKRIAYNRKRLGLTQDQLAEQLGVTAQAVSKWENDQSCPDIQTLPKLAGIFGITTDELLGAEPAEQRRPVMEAEVVDGQDRSGDNHIKVKVRMDSGRRFLLGLAIWLLLAGGMMVLEPAVEATTWEILWSTALLVFGLMGLYPRFSVFRLGMAVLGGLSLYLNCVGIVFSWPVVLMILGALLLLEVLLGKKHKSFEIPVVGNVNTGSDFHMDGETFTCNTSFGEKHYRVDLPRLSGGSSSLSFGEVELDLTGCGEITEGCRLNLNTSFGQTRLVVPGNCLIRPDVKTSFGAMQTRGQPDGDASRSICLTGSVAFGELEICYR